MKHFLILLLAFLCLAHLVSTGGRNQKKEGKKLSELEERLSAMEKQVDSMVKFSKEAKAGFEELGGKVDKMSMLFAKDVCKLSPVKGHCEAIHPMYYYNHKKQRCMKFYYGGCGGNVNNFDSLEKCQNTCGDKAGTFCPAGSYMKKYLPNKCSKDGPCPGGYFCHTTGVCCSNPGCPPNDFNIQCLVQEKCQRPDGSPGCDAGLLCCPNSPSCGSSCIKRGQEAAIPRPA